MSQTLQNQSTKTVTLYSLPGCGGCIATKRAFDSKNIKFEEVDVTQDAEAFEYVTKTLGYNQMPVVDAGDNHWSGFKPAEIETLV